MRMQLYTGLEMLIDIDLKRPYAMEVPFGSMLKWLPPVIEGTWYQIAG